MSEGGIKLAGNAGGNNIKAETGWSNSILAITTVILVGRAQDIIPGGLGIIRPGYMVLALLMGLILFCSGSLSFIRCQLDVVSKLTYLFILLMYLSIIFAEFKGKSFYFLQQFITIPLYFFCVCRYSTTKSDLRKHMWVMTLIVLLYAILAFGKMDVVERVHVGEMYDPNELSLIMVGTLPLMFFLFQCESKGLKKVVLLVTILLSFLTIVATKSRGGLLGLGVSSIALLFMRTNISRSRFGIRKIATAVILIAAFAFFATEAYWERMETTIEGQDKGSGRTEVWKRAIDMIGENPIVGVGIGNFTSSYGFRLRSGSFSNLPSDRTWAPNRWVTAHNSFLLVGAELGFPGLILYVCMLGSCFLSCVKVRRQALEEGDAFLFSAAGFIFASLLGYVVCSMFLSFSYKCYQFYLIAIIVILSSIAKANEVEP